ncbi:MAG: hypothetical protein GX672_04045 [Synergistaceae bacterium]|nr:hypothetical protein [Synergistaceae bacterium]
MSVNDVMVQWADEYVAQYGHNVILSSSYIKTEITKRGLKVGSIMPSDHCYNRVNEDSTSHGSKTSLFVYVSRKNYQCVGSKYEYGGKIFCKPKGASQDTVWGYYDSKARKKVQYPKTSDPTAKHTNVEISEPKDIATKGLDKTLELKSAFEPFCAIGRNILTTKPLDRGFLDSIERYLKEKKKLYESPIVKSIEERKSGRKFLLCDHLRGYIYAQLSNNRPWEPLEPHLSEIDEIFCNYDLNEIINKINSVGYEFFVRKITGIKCGNRGINAQMQALKRNITVFTDLIDRYGSLDEFVTSRPVLEIIKMLSDLESPYKLRTMGIPLTSEYLRNVGIDCPKPDVHLCRIFGNKRLGASLQENSTPTEVFQIIASISERTGYSQAMIDNIIWSYCAEGYGAICTSKPHCCVCVIQDYCRLSY